MEPRLQNVWTVILVSSLLSAFHLVAGDTRCDAQSVYAATAPRLNVAESVQNAWAMYAPWHASGVVTPLPASCEIVQANIIQRHGARYPTTGSGKQIAASVALLQKARNLTGQLAFLNNYTYALGTNDLVPFGAAQSFDAGSTHYETYKHLVQGNNLPFVRSDNSQRVVDSATNWTAGFAAASQHKYTPKLAVILDSALNDTLDDAMCPNAGSSDEQDSQWINVFAPPIAARLNAAAPGANLSASDAVNLMALCAFETIAKESASHFCALFSQAEWDSYEYYGDLDKYYGTGYGQALGPVQGVGYVNELLARLTGQPVRDHTQTNATLDASPATFPLNRTLYADFSHDNQMAAIFAALGLFRQRAPLDPVKPDARRTWWTTRLVPFSGRMVVEKVRCARQRDELVRILVNDAVQPLEFCGSPAGGLCDLQAFVRSQGYARADGAGDWEKCF